MVKVNVPGVGEITAENAASEDTLKKLVRAVEDANRQRVRGDTTEQRAQKKSLTDQTKAINDSTRTTGRYNREMRETTEQHEEYNEVLDETMTRTRMFALNTVGTLTTTLTDLGLSAVAVSAQLMTQYDDMAKNPIGAAQGMMNTAIDLGTMVIKRTTEMVTGLAGAATTWIPFAGESLEKLSDTANRVAQGMFDAAQVTMKLANDVFAKELQKSSEALINFTNLGASFAGGLTEMRQTAVSAGLTIDRFSESVSLSSDNLRMAGFSQGEGAKMLAKVMGETARITDSAGLSLRDQMLGLGVSYEEQGEIIAQLMATQRLGNMQRQMDEQELAEATRDYVTDLKVLRDITGEDAKAAMDAARAKAMEADIIAQLGSAKEIEKFQKALAATPEPLRKGFLEFVSSGGKVVTDQAANIMMAQVPELRTHMENVFAGIKDPTVEVNTMLDTTLTGFQEVGVKARELGGVMASAVRLGNVIGGVADAVAIQNDLIRISMISPEEVAASRKAATEQSTLTDQQSRNLVELTKITNDHAVKMEGLINQHMGTYTEYSKQMLDAATSAIHEGIKLLGMSPEELKNSIMEKVAGMDAEVPPEVEARKSQFDQDMAAINAKLDAAKKELADTGYQWWNLFQSMTPEMEKAKAELEALKQQRAERENQNWSDKRYQMGDRPAVTGPGKANGGIAMGPKSGYHELLHGIEAVVPLPDGKTIPVKMDAPGINQSMVAEIAQQVVGKSDDLMNQIVGTMRQMGFNSDLLAGKLDYIDFQLAELFQSPAIRIETPEMDQLAANRYDPVEFSKEDLAKIMLDSERSLVTSLVDELKASVTAPSPVLSERAVETQTKMLQLLEQLIDRQDATVRHLENSVRTQRRLLDVSS